MRRTTLLIATAVLLGAAALPAAAQFGTMFGGPPRPPADVPDSGAGPLSGDDRYYSSRPNNSPWTRQPQVVSPPPGGYPPPPPGYPQQGYPQQGYPQQGYPPPPPGYPGAPQQAGRPPGGIQQPGIQQQDLPPPPGGTAGLPPGQRPPPRGTPGETPVTPAPPNDEVVIQPPAQKIPNNQATFSGLDKITGRIIAFDVAINETVQFGALQVTPRVCYTRPPTEAANTDAFIEVDEITLQGEIKRLFTGWMFAASPGLNAIEHPIYDIWLSDCKGPQTPTVAEVTPEPARPGQQKQLPRTKQAAPPLPQSAQPQTVPPPQPPRAQQQPKQLPPPPLLR